MEVIGAYAQVFFDEFPDAEWDSFEPVSDDCAAAPALRTGAEGLLHRLRAGSSLVRSIDDVIALTEGSKSWSEFVDPALSVVIPDGSISAVVLYECNSHCLALVGWKRTWSLVSRSEEVVGVVEAIRHRRLAAMPPAEAPATEESGPMSETSMEVPLDADPEQELLREMWAAAGFSTEKAMPWISAGLLPLHAERWQGWDVREAVTFSLAALRPAAVQKWSAQHPDEPLIEWISAGFDLRSTEEWISAGYSLAQARSHAANGIRHPRHIVH